MESDSNTHYHKYSNLSFKYSLLYIKCFLNQNSSEFLTNKSPNNKKNLKIKDKFMINSSNLSLIWDVSINFTPKLKPLLLSSNKFTNTFPKSWWNLNSSILTVKHQIWTKLQFNKLTIWELMHKRKVTCMITQNLSSEIWTVWSETSRQDKPEKKWKKNFKEEN